MALHTNTPQTPFLSCVQQDLATKLGEEREVLARDVGVLRSDLDSTRMERDRLLAENTRMTADVERIRWARFGNLCCPSPTL